ncbi:MAG: hypothetical protein WCP21_07695 [Armatimonadota bacterium]
MTIPRLVTLLILASLAATSAFAFDLPDNSLWLAEGRVRTQGAALQVPAEMLQATNVNTLQAVGKALVVWTVQQRDADSKILSFELHLADVERGTDRLLLKGVDPFGQGPEWWLQRVQLSKSGKALLVRIRLSGSGGFVEVHKLLLDGSGAHYPVPEGTPVWSDISADGSTQVMPTWGLTADAPHLADNQRKFGSLIVADTHHPQGRWLWKIAHYADIPQWAGYEIESPALSPDGKQIAYACAAGLWVVPVAGGTPRLVVPMPTADIVVDDLVWARDGSGVYFTGVRYADPGAREMISYVPLKGGLAWTVRGDAGRLCLPRL